MTLVGHQHRGVLFTFSVGEEVEVVEVLVYDAREAKAFYGATDSESLLAGGKRLVDADEALEEGLRETARIISRAASSFRSSPDTADRGPSDHG